MSAIKLNSDAGGGSVSFKGPGTTGNDVELTLPTAIGANDQYLKLSGVSGQTASLAWATPATSADNKPAFQVYKGGDSGSHQNISNATNTKVTWSHEYLDTDNCFASDKFTPTQAGWYFFNVSLLINFGEAEDEYGTVMLYKNGSSIFEARRVEGVGTMSQALHYNFMAQANGSGDYFEIYVYQNSGGTRELDRHELSTWWNGFKLIGLS